MLPWDTSSFPQRTVWCEGEGGGLRSDDFEEDAEYDEDYEDEEDEDDRYDEYDEEWDDSDTVPRHGRRVGWD